MTFHCVEYIYDFIVYEIIKNFKRISVPCKADEQVLVFVLSLAFIELAIISGSVERPANIRFGNAVLKCGGVKLYGKVHALSYSVFVLPSIRFCYI